MPIIPKPAKVTRRAGVFSLSPHSLVSYPQMGRQAGELIQKLTGLETTNGSGAIRFEEDCQVLGEEAYRLEIDSTGIRMAASAAAGLFYAAQTLRQLLPAAVEQAGITEPVALPFIYIEDRPRFQHRGFMLDVSRHFFGPVEIKRIIDLLALLGVSPASRACYMQPQGLLPVLSTIKELLSREHPAIKEYKKYKS